MTTNFNATFVDSTLCCHVLTYHSLCEEYSYCCAIALSYPYVTWSVLAWNDAVRYLLGPIWQEAVIVEIDGGQHYEADGLASDARRDNYLASEGYKVLRFSNHNVLTNLPGVLDVISSTIHAEAPSLTSPASGGGEEGGDAA